MKKRTTIIMLTALALFALLLEARAVTPAPDGCYPNFTTAEGCEALNVLTSGLGNTAVGWRSLFSDTTGSFSTGVGAGTLVFNNGDSNTAVGAGALLLNTTGSTNTAVGTDAMVFNVSGSSNTTIGYFSLINNTTGSFNTAIGSEALTVNTTGSNNTAIGNQALQSSVTTSDNVVVGSMAGSAITTANNNIIIGHHSGVHSVFGQESDRCYIDNIFGAPVSADTAVPVFVDSDGRLGTAMSTAVRYSRQVLPNSRRERTPPSGFSSKITRVRTIPDASNQTSLDRTIETLQATFVQQQQRIEKLTTQLKENAAQIHEVKAELEVKNPEAKLVVNKP